MAASRLSGGFMRFLSCGVKYHFFGIMALVLSAPALSDGWDSDTQATNRNSVANTRHNLTVSYSRDPDGAGWQIGMDQYVEGSGGTMGRWNQYGEVCVYCHTPHGASSTEPGPLWNRASSRGDSQYWRYGDTTMSGQVAQTQYGDFPWPSLAGRTRRMNLHSMMCLSCHDGTVGMDAVLNMPGSGKYSTVGEWTGGSYNGGAVNTFLSTWTNSNGLTTNHLPMNSCFGCHSTGSGLRSKLFPFKEGWVAPYVSGSMDLRDDHPVAINLPDTSFYDFNPPTGFKGDVAFYDNNVNGRLNKQEVRFYDYGSGYSVECSSCHDPHGVESAGPGSEFIPSFLRSTNARSELCLTCHVK